MHTLDLGNLNIYVMHRFVSFLVLLLTDNWTRCLKYRCSMIRRIFRLLEVLTVYGTEFRLFSAKSFTLLILLMSCIWLAAIGTSFNVVSYDAVFPRIEPITSPTPGGCANCYATDAVFFEPDRQTNESNIYTIDDH